MRRESARRFRSLRARLISRYLVILGIGGLATSVVGSWIVSSTILRETSRSVDSDLRTARMVYQEQLRTLERAVDLAGSGITIQHYLARNDRASLLAFLERIRHTAGFDFIGLAGGDGRVLARVPQSARAGDAVTSLRVVTAALNGQVSSATEILSPEALEREDPALRQRARIRAVSTAHAAPPDTAELTSGMVLLAAAPLRASPGALYGGVLLNRNFSIVDRVEEIVFRGGGMEDGTVTIFLADMRISTTVKDAAGERAVGTRVSTEVRSAVLDRGQTWRGRAFVVRDWYLAGYEPIRDSAGRAAGMLYVGVPETVYTGIRNGVILSFFGIATVGFVLILGVTYYMMRSITQPLARMAAATRNIAAGRFEEQVRADEFDEIAQLAESFNTMLASLRQMRSDLEEWGRTLEQKVRQRSDELVTMQVRVAQSERLASLGLLAAGVAHEINNPLGGVLALTGLTLEELPQDHPSRENLEEVLKQAHRCRDIVRGLLDFSRQTRIAVEPVDVNRALEDTLSLIAQQSAFFNIEVVKRFSPDLPPVQADRSQLQQVLLNVIINAVQAMNERGTLTLATGSGGGLVEVRIQDTGPGIPPDRIDRVFDPFFTTKESGRGTGLGLSIAYGIVKKHSGTITVSSGPGAGTTFVIHLPVAVRVEEA